MINQGDKWKPKDTTSEAEWYVASVEKGVVTLSGPGPARSVMYVTSDDLKEEWEKVKQPT